MNADKLNMVVGSAIGALLAFLLLGFSGSQIFGTFGGGHHGPEELAFAVEVEETVVEDEGATDYAALVASANLDAGAKVFSKCKSCHKVDAGANGVGPTLYGVVGHDIAAVDGYGYSAALSEKEGDWGLENLSAFLENPKGWAPGTKMGFAGLKKPEDRVNLIAWLNENDGSPIVLAAAPVETATDATTEEAAATEEPAESTEAVEATEEAATEEPAAETTEVAAVTPEPEATEEAEPAEATEEAATEEPAAEATEVAAAPAGGAYSALIAGVDLAQGKKTFRKCRACHKLEEGKNGVGPTLWGVVGRGVAGVDGYGYSDAMVAKGGTWTVEELMNYLEAPRSYVPGTKMAFAGVKDEQDRMNLIAYINEEDGSPEPLE